MYIETKEIVKKLQEEEKDGNQCAIFFNSRISDETRKELRNEGIEPLVFTHNELPCFKVSR